MTVTVTRMVANEQLARFVYTLPIRLAALLGEGARPPVLDVELDLAFQGVVAAP